MSTPLVSKHKADILSILVLVIGLIALYYLNRWWPDCLLLFWLTLSSRQYLRGRYYDIILTTFVFGGLFLHYYVHVVWNILLPVLFTIGAIYLIFREYTVFKVRSGNDQIEDMNTEMTDAREDHKL
jgi:hypothetical protein